jgi:transcriptional regulator with XRE-family HTH domain
MHRNGCSPFIVGVPRLMDMKLNPSLIKSLREQKAWSQEHLADASGVAVRTIQRVEAGGSASYETAQALAAVFGTEVADLQSRVAEVRSTPRWRRGALAAAALGAILLIGTSAFFIKSAAARPLLVDIAMTWVDGGHSDLQVITREGKEAVIEVSGQFRFVITPTINRQRGILLSTRIYLFDGRSYEMHAHPALLTQDNAAATIRSTTDTGKTYEITLTPHLLARGV